MNDCVSHIPVVQHVCKEGHICIQYSYRLSLLVHNIQFHSIMLCMHAYSDSSFQLHGVNLHYI